MINLIEYINEKLSLNKNLKINKDILNIIEEELEHYLSSIHITHHNYTIDSKFDQRNGREYIIIKIDFKEVIKPNYNLREAIVNIITDKLDHQYVYVKGELAPHSIGTEFIKSSNKK